MYIHVVSFNFLVYSTKDCTHTVFTLIQHTFPVFKLITTEELNDTAGDVHYEIYLFFLKMHDLRHK